MDKKLKKVKKELSKIEERLESLQREKADLEHKLSSLETEKSSIISICSDTKRDEQSILSELRAIKAQIKEVQERLEEVGEFMIAIQAKRDELKQEANELETKIVEEARKKFRLQFEDKLEYLAKEFKELWPIAQAGNRFLIPEHFAQQIGRIALKSAIEAGELAGDNLLKQEVAK